MALLYGYKWTSTNGEEFDERTHAGQVWLAKTADLTNEEWFKAVDRCEKEVTDRLKTGDDCWPPSYQEFISYATEFRNRAHKVFTPRLPESKEAKEERKARGRERIGTLRAIFDE